MVNLGPPNGDPLNGGRNNGGITYGMFGMLPFNE
jgi:hypothetical protein